jgi:hypothetical protein
VWLVSQTIPNPTFQPLTTPFKIPNSIYLAASRLISLTSSPHSHLKESEPLPESTSHYQQHTHEPSQPANTPANTCSIISTVSASFSSILSTYVSRKGNTSSAPGVFLQSLIRSIAMPNIPMRCTPASSIRRFASAASLSVKVPLASVLAHTS